MTSFAVFKTKKRCLVIRQFAEGTPPSSCATYEAVKNASYTDFFLPHLPIRVCLSSNMTTHSAKGTLSLSESLQQSLKSKHDAIEFVKPFIELPTIVAAGMCLQALAFLIIPHYIAVAPAVVLLCYKAITSKTVTVADNWLVNQKWAGRMTATIPNEDGSIPEKGATNGLVCFFVGVQVNQYLLSPQRTLY